MKTYRMTRSGAEYVSQSRVIHSGRKMDGRNRWSAQILRRRARFGGRERRGWTLFLAAGRYRGEIGTR